MARTDLGPYASWKKKKKNERRRRSCVLDLKLEKAERGVRKCLGRVTRKIIGWEKILENL